jgi:hypothetical protein
MTLRIQVGVKVIEITEEEARELVARLRAEGCNETAAVIEEHLP